MQRKRHDVICCQRWMSQRFGECKMSWTTSRDRKNKRKWWRNNRTSKDSFVVSFYWFPAVIHRKLGAKGKNLSLLKWILTQMQNKLFVNRIRFSCHVSLHDRFFVNFNYDDEAYAVENVTRCNNRTLSGTGWAWWKWTVLNLFQFDWVSRMFLKFLSLN